MIKYSKFLALALLVFVSSFSIRAQEDAFTRYQPGIKSPEASSLGQFGEIPVSLFNGLPEISIPLTSVKCGDISFPVDLQYYAGGNRPDQHAGWTGLGWNLNAGGVITRQVNGMRDESTAKGWPNYDESYITKKGELANSNWSTISFLNQLPRGLDRSYLSPDEFAFNVNGISGSFFLNYDGTWKVKSKQGIKIDIESEVSTEYPLAIEGSHHTIYRAFTKFTLIMGDGTRYVFGGQQNAIDFSYPSMPGMRYFGPPQVFQEYYSENDPWHKVEANAWRLVKIISPKGHTVDFIYSELGFSLNQNSFINTYNLRGLTNYGNSSVSQNLVTTYYLEKIKIDNNVEYTFNRSLSNELNYTWFIDGWTYNDFEMFGLPARWGFCKLDNIKVTEAGNLIQEIAFDYIENSTERLKLRRVISKANNSELRNIYKLDYNPKLLPAYNAGGIDHWGYSNGRTFQGSSSVLSAAEGAAYYQSREPDANFLDAEILQKITYPTGGYTQFEFEPHEYSSLISLYPDITCNSINQNKMAGGLRIKKIISNDNVDKTVTKEFFYIKDYITGGSLSSGILSGTPKYYEEGSYSTGGSTNSYKILNSGALNYLNNTNGNHVTYSEIVEKSGEGYTVHKFQNHDNGFIDKPAFTTTYYSSNIPPDLYIYKTYGKLELERGLPTSQSYYSAGLKLLKEVKYEYNDDPNRYQEYVRSISVPNRIPTPTIYASAHPIYTFFPYRKGTITKEYNEDGGGIANVTIREYEYDIINRNLKKEKLTTSLGDKIITEYKYPSDLVAAGEDPTGVYNEMKNKHILSVVVEKKTLRDDALLSTNKINFYKSSAGIYLPASIDIKQGDGPNEKRMYFREYDSKGNILEMQKSDNISEVYLWGYNSLFPVAKITGSTYSVARVIVDQNVLNNPVNDQSLRTELEKLRLNLPEAVVSTYTYSPLKGITSETDPQGRTIYYEYDGFNRLSLIRDKDNNILKKICYNYAGQPENCLMPHYNTEQWKYFSKDCAPGYMTTPLKYTVPAYKYSSLVSPEDANDKAWNEINTFGQSTINDIGKCVLICTGDNCSGPGKKCVNNNCEMGTKILVQSMDMVTYYICTFQWVWSDGTSSAQFEETTGMGGCGMP